MKRTLFFVFVFVVSVPVLAYATPVTYVASGTVAYEVNNQVIESDLEGFVTIDDEVMSTWGSGGHPFYQYDVLDFAINTEYDLWTGGGWFLLEEDMDTIAFRDGLLDDFVWAKVDFQDEYAMSYDRYDIGSWMTLSPQITMFADDFLTYSSCNPLQTNIILTQVVPVPEPSTVFLLGIGLSCVASVRRRAAKL